MNNKTTIQNLYKGIFWIRDDLSIEQSEDYCIKIPCDLNGAIDEEISISMTAKSMSNHNHKIYWNEMMNSSLTKGKPFDYYPRGRVEIKRNKATIFLNSNIYTNEVVNFIVNQYCLTNSGIKKIRVVADNSEHYQCHLDTGIDNMGGNKMKKWILLVNKERFEFSNFHDAATMLKAEISKHMEINEDVFGREGDPFSPGAFFSGRYLDGTITDEDIVVSTRLNMLCRSFIWRGIDFAKDNAQKSVLNSIHYMSKNDEFGEQLNIDIDVKKDEIVLDVTHYDSEGKETYMRSNAFIFDDLHKKYYFKSHQIVTTTSQKDDLGKVVDLNIFLKEEE